MADPDEKCIYCRVSARVARSRLHDLDHVICTYISYITYLEGGAADGCEICGLIVESFRSWEGASVYLKSDMRAYLYIHPSMRGCTVQIWLCWPISYQKEASVKLDIFNMVGFKTDWCIRQLREASTGPLSSQAVATVKQWLSDCEQNHNCHKIASKSIPKRFLEISECQLRLREDIEFTPRYACLSHCWGRDGPALRLTSETHQLLTRGMENNHLPRTFADAVTLCLSVDVRYIWIDALCYFQDSSKDWNDAAASMADVYEGASITIAAASSRSSEQGFPSTYQDVSTTRPIENTGLFVSERDTFPDGRAATGFTHADPIDAQYRMSSWPLLTRAWVYQERKLSACVIHVGKTQLYWECRESFRSENGRDDVLYPNDAALTLKHEVDEPHKAWRKDVEHYSLLQLSFEKDRLPAISAVVERMQSTRPGDTYIAGLWLNTLLHDLAWHLRGPALPRPKSYHPTWSWISVKTGVNYSLSEPLPSVRLLKVDYEIAGPKHIGRTLYARIELVGKTFSVEWSTQYGSDEYVAVQPVFQSLFAYKFDYPDFEYSTARPPIENGETLDCLILFQENDLDGTHLSYGSLVLRKTETGWFERVGIIRVSVRMSNPEEYSRSKKKLGEFMDSLPDKRFTIV